MAGRGREILLRIVGDGDDAKRKLAEVTTDLREFGQLNAEARADIKTQGAEAKLQVLRDRLFRLGQQEANPKVQIKMASTLAQIEVLEAKLEKLDHKSVNVDVDVSRGGTERSLSFLARAATTATTAVGALFSVFASGGQAVVQAASSFGNVGAAISSLVAVAPEAVPFLIAIAAALAVVAGSALVAVAGIGALVVALAAVAAPVAILGIVALPRLVAIFKALHEQHTKTAQSAQAVASAHDQVVSATEAVSSAQENLRTQTDAAWRAMRDSAEAYKDDLLDVQHAQLGIAQSQLRVDQAKQHLKDLLAGTGVNQQDLSGLFRKLTDVNAPTDPAAIAKAIAAAGGKDLTAANQLDVRQALLDVKDATLGVKDANDRLHDSNVKLHDDAQTQADFAKRGIAAYEPYRAALKQVTDANRSLAAAQRAQAAATVAQGGAMANLSPSERKFAAVIERIQKRIKQAFGPALDAVFAGLGKGLDAATKGLTDPKVVGAITALGRAVGSVFAALGKELSRPETRDAFVQLAKGAAELMRELGKKAAIDLFRLFLRVAVAALPGLIDLISRFVGWLDGLEKGSRNSRKLRKDIKDAIDTAVSWINTIIDIVNAVGKFLLFMRNAWRKVKGFVGDAADFAKDKLGDVVSFISSIPGKVEHFAKRIGSAIKNGIMTGVHGVVGFVKGVFNDVIGVFNAVIGHINDITPGAIKVLGETITPGIPDVPLIPQLASGGIALRDTLARIGEAGREAVIPLRADVLSALGQAIAVATPQMALAGVGGVPGPRAGVHIDHVTAPVSVVGGGPPDPRMLSSEMEQELRKMGRGR